MGAGGEEGVLRVGWGGEEGGGRREGGSLILHQPHFSTTFQLFNHGAPWLAHYTGGVMVEVASGVPF